MMWCSDQRLRNAIRHHEETKGKLLFARLPNMDEPRVPRVYSGIFPGIIFGHFAIGK